MTFPPFLYASVALTLVFIHSGSQTASIAASLFALKFSEGFSDINAAFFQKANVSHFIAVSAVFRFVACLVIFVPVYELFHSIQLSLLALAIVWLILFLLFDNRFRKRIATLKERVFEFDHDAVFRRWRLFKTTLPLGCSGTVMILMNYLPRLGLNSYSGLNEVGLCSAIQYFLTFGAMFTVIVSQALLPTLANCVVEKKLVTFTVLLGVFAFFIGIGCGFVWLVAHFAGNGLLSFIYGPQFRGLQSLFENSVPSMFFVLSGIVMAAGATAFHLYRTIFCTYVIAALVVAGMTWLLVPKLQAVGAFYALGAGALTQTLVLAVAVAVAAARQRQSV
jgi:O-antigen/teichoic acid export membrane protein